MTSVATLGPSPGHRPHCDDAPHPSPPAAHADGGCRPFGFVMRCLLRCRVSGDIPDRTADLCPYISIDRSSIRSWQAEPGNEGSRNYHGLRIFAVQYSSIGVFTEVEPVSWLFRIY